MAVETVKSTAITNRDSTPAKLSSPNLSNAEVRSFVGVCAISATASSGSKYIFGSIPSNARIRSLRLSTDLAGGGSFAGTLGLYDTTANGGAAIGSEDQFGTSIDLHTAALTGTEEQYHAGASKETIANAEKMVWDMLGLASDPSKFYDVVLTTSADNSTNAINAALDCTFVV